MYNILAKEAYKERADYFITLNDDAILRSSNWTSSMIRYLYHNPVYSNFGTTGFIAEDNFKLIQFNFVSRIHLDIFKLNFYPPVYNFIIIYSLCQIGGLIYGSANHMNLIKVVF